MENFKKFTLFITATIAVIFLIAWTLDSFGFRSLISALLINWLVMSWIAIVGQVIQVSFPAAYYNFRPFEQTGLVYQRIGIRLFKKLVRRGPLTIFSPTLRFPQERTGAALQNLESGMRKAETGHALAFMLMLSPVGYALLNRWLDAVVWMMLFNILINGYPVMLQRYNRIKLQDLIHATT